MPRTYGSALGTREICKQIERQKEMNEVEEIDKMIIKILECLVKTKTKSAKPHLKLVR